ncbi:hypothetical protein JHK85_016414 [Glycine max]|nr:hypothetical protein JHK85_016414 [Glycine max]KAG5046634.1 hypothetical protein JHK86_016040 [Glycine max]
MARSPVTRVLQEGGIDVVLGGLRVQEGDVEMTSERRNTIILRFFPSFSFLHTSVIPVSRNNQQHNTNTRLFHSFYKRTMTLASSFPTPQVHAFDNPARRRRRSHFHIINRNKPHRTLHFLLIPTSPSPSSSLLFSCSSFPLTHSDPILQFRHHHLLSTDGNFIVEDLSAAVEEDVSPATTARIFVQEPPWLFLKGLLMQEEEMRQKDKEREKYNLLRRRQIEAETEAWEKMVEEYRELEREMREKMLAPNLPHVKSLLLGWFEPFRAAVEAEQTAHRARPKKQQDSIAPHVDDLPADKVAVIVMHKMMAMVMENEEGCVQLVHAAVHIGMALEQELGSRLVELLIDTAYVHSPVNQSADTPPDIRPAFRHGFKAVPWHPGYDKGGHLFLPSYIMRTHGSKKQQDVMKNVDGAQMQKVFEALDILGNTKWRVNRRVLGVVESIWAGGGNIAGLVDCKDEQLTEIAAGVPKPDKPLVEDLKLIQEWKCNVRKAKKINLERHSLRCDTELKLSVARKMKDEEGFYYPHNLDFRGRAYPMHPHLNHLGSDLCRGLLEFAEGRPLGKSGLRWLKIHLANLYAGGIEKQSYDGRLGFIEDHIHDIFDSADHPINGNRWWLTAEDPFQCLAACINLSEALRSSSPNSFISHLPIHQDGSCNGLQHYAALGRDDLEAAAVNLVAKEKPADVYTEIAIDRKLVKQTVMTSVYGVTYIGAREQIKRRLGEKGFVTDDRLLYAASCYAAKVTLAALGEVFEAARGIMGWLGDCAKGGSETFLQVIACENQAVCWTTPLGLPVVQPYCKTERYQVSVKKQRSAFPPNFVHSLDSSHMMMTALACNDAGLCFAGVHDSFWTHPCDVEKMNQILREKFVELYNMPILENLLEGFQTTYPGLAFPPLPKRGSKYLGELASGEYLTFGALIWRGKLTSLTLLLLIGFETILFGVMSLEISICCTLCGDHS